MPTAGVSIIVIVIVLFLPRVPSVAPLRTTPAAAYRVEAPPIYASGGSAALPFAARLQLRFAATAAAPTATDIRSRGSRTWGGIEVFRAWRCRF
jgi:hypothetical protein